MSGLYLRHTTQDKARKRVLTSAQPYEYEAGKKTYSLTSVTGLGGRMSSKLAA